MKVQKKISENKLHLRNKHKGSYNFKALIKSNPSLAQFVKPNKYGNESVDFFNPEAVKALNTALLKHFYGIQFWEIPQNYLCPPIPGRADYIHYLADLIQPKTENIKCLDVGVGANCVYPIIGAAEYGWHFVGTDIDPVALEAAGKIVEQNDRLKGVVDLRLQNNKSHVFKGVVKNDEHFDLAICNPPFHGSLAEAKKGSIRKLQNLKGIKIKQPVLNFGGQNNELWCAGGEEQFIRNMIFESVDFAKNFTWFSTLISKQAHVKNAYKTLKKVKAKKIKVIEMSQGNKVSRILVWRF